MKKYLVFLFIFLAGAIFFTAIDVKAQSIFCPSATGIEECSTEERRITCRNETDGQMEGYGCDPNPLGEGCVWIPLTPISCPAEANLRCEDGRGCVRQEDVGNGVEEECKCPTFPIIECLDNKKGVVTRHYCDPTDPSGGCIKYQASFSCPDDEIECSGLVPSKKKWECIDTIGCVMTSEQQPVCKQPSICVGNVVREDKFGCRDGDGCYYKRTALNNCDSLCGPTGRTRCGGNVIESEYACSTCKETPWGTAMCEPGTGRRFWQPAFPCPPPQKTSFTFTAGYDVMYTVCTLTIETSGQCSQNLTLNQSNSCDPPTISYVCEDRSGVRGGGGGGPGGWGWGGGWSWVLWRLPMWQWLWGYWSGGNDGGDGGGGGGWDDRGPRGAEGFYVTHNRCNAQRQCVSVAGAGPDQCSNNQNCLTETHNECNAQRQCVSVAGAGPDQCSNDQNCITGTRNECNAQRQCVSVAGIGINRCPNDDWCVNNSRIHTKCDLLQKRCVSFGVGDGLGKYTSTAIGPDGNSRISYYDETNRDLKFVRCTNPDCTTKVITTVDSDDNVGQYTSTAIGPDGNSRISYYGETGGGLKFVRCTNPDCTTKIITTITEANFLISSQYISIAIGPDGNSRISYYDATNGDLKFVRCTNPDCTTKVITTVDSDGNVGQYTSTAIGSDGNNRISYYDVNNRNLKFVRCADPDCATKVINTADFVGDVGRYTSIAIGSDGNSRMSYYDVNNRNLKFVRCADPDCATKVITTVDSDDNVGQYTSIAIGSDGNNRISYYDANSGSLKFVRCTDPDCATKVITTVDSISNQCSSNSDCGRNNYNKCNTLKQCISVTGVGIDQCQNETDCMNNTHNQCNALQQCVVVNGFGQDQCSNDSQCVNEPPFADQLISGAGNSCTGIRGAGIAYFQWRYQDTEGDRQRKFTLQIDDNPDFLSPEVNRTFDNLSYSAGTLNQQVVLVRMIPTIPSGDYIGYNIPYYWRVKVEQWPLNLSSDWIQAPVTFTMIGHPAPVPEFGFTPSNPAPGASINFNNISNCYNNAGPAACASYLWNFGDGATSASQDPTHSYDTARTYAVSLQACDETNCCSIEKLVPVRIQGDSGLPRWKEISPFER